jgi:hypothetical protein
VVAVVRELGGQLAVHSEPNAGTRWTLTFAGAHMAAQFADSRPSS